MARVEGYPDLGLCYKTELKSVVCGHHVYTLLVRTFSLLQVKGKKGSVTMSLPSLNIKTKSVVYWLGTYQ